jgi:hypothetical protein
MNSQSNQRALGAFLVLALVASGCGGPKEEPAQEASQPAEPAVADPVVEPEADALLKRMSDHLAGAPAFRLTTEETHERVKHDGTKTTLAFARDMVVERPGHMWLRAKGENLDVEGWYDAKEFTIRQAEKKMYAQVVVPPNIDDFLDYMATRVAVRMPMADLFYESAYESYVGPETAGRVVGVEDVGGVKATHLAFQDPVADFDIWIQDGDKPLPVKLQLSYKASRGAPVSVMTFKSWDLEPEVDPAMFTFTPAKDDVRIRFAGQARPAPAQG